MPQPFNTPYQADLTTYAKKDALNLKADLANPNFTGGVTTVTLFTELITPLTYTLAAIVLLGIYFDGTDIVIKNAAGTIRTPYIQRDVAVLTKYKSVAQSIAFGTIANILFENVNTDNTQGTTGLTYTSATGVFTNTSTLTKTYSISASVNMVGGTVNSDRAVWIRNGNNRYGCSQIYYTNTAGAIELNASAVLVLAANETFSIQAFNDSSLASLTLGFDTSIQRTHVVIALV
jgi:hypothetical protein